MLPDHRRVIRRVILTGFMGAGKTTVGGLLAPMLGWRFFDTDSMLCEQTGSTIAAFFSLHGEQAFRADEAALIDELAEYENAVVALGGGALEHPDTMRRLSASPDSLLVYLETSLELSLQRCAADEGAPVRPVLADRAALEQRFDTRVPLYKRASLIVPVANRSPNALAHEIADAVRRS